MAVYTATQTKTGSVCASDVMILKLTSDLKRHYNCSNKHM